MWLSYYWLFPQTSLTILMYEPCILYSLLSRPTNAQYIYMFIYLCIVSTPTCFNASASSSGILILLLGYIYKSLLFSGFPIKLYHRHLSSPIRLRQAIYSSHIILLYTIMLSIFCEMYWLWSYYYANVSSASLSFLSLASQPSFSWRFLSTFFS